LDERRHYLLISTEALFYNIVLFFKMRWSVFTQWNSMQWQRWVWMWKLGCKWNLLSIWWTFRNLFSQCVF